MDFREKRKDLSGAALKAAIIKNRKEKIIDLVCRQTDYTSEKAEERLLFWKNNYLHVIREWMNPNFSTKKKEKTYTSVNQGIIGEIRNFMDEGVRQKKLEDRKKAYIQHKMAEAKAKKEKVMKEKAMLEGNKKIIT